MKADGVVTPAIADMALDLLKVDKQGFDMMDRKLLSAVLDNFGGGPVGLDALAASISEESDTIEDVIEPYLIQQGFLMRTPRGRVATSKCYLHFGLPGLLDFPISLVAWLVVGHSGRHDNDIVFCQMVRDGLGHFLSGLDP